MIIETEKNLSERLDEYFNIPEEEVVYDRKDVLNLFDLYFKGEIDEDTFEDKYYKMYTRDGATNFSPGEKKILDDLGKVVHRFSSFPEDFIEAPGVYTTKEEFRDKVIKAKRSLDMSQNEKSYSNTNSNHPADRMVNPFMSRFKSWFKSKG